MPAPPVPVAVAGCCCSPYVIGAMYEKTHTHFSGMYVMGAGLAVAAVIVAAYQPRWSESKAMPHAPSSPNLEKDVKSVDQC